MAAVLVRDVDAHRVPEPALGRRGVAFDEADPAEDETRPGGIAGGSRVEVQTASLLQLGASLRQPALHPAQRAKREVRPRLGEHALAAVLAGRAEHVLRSVELEAELEQPLQRTHCAHPEVLTVGFARDVDRVARVSLREL